MAAMAQTDCGQCGYSCQAYAEAIASGVDSNIGRCTPGGKATSRKLKELLAEIAAPAGRRRGFAAGGAPRSRRAPAGNAARARRALPRQAARGTAAQSRRVGEGHAARRARNRNRRRELPGRRQPRRRRAQLPRAGGGDHRAPGGDAGNSGAVARRHRAAAVRGALASLRDPPPVRPGDRGLVVAGPRHRRIADAAGDGRGLSRRRAGRRRSLGPARKLPLGAPAALRADLGARPAAAAALFDRLVAETRRRRSSSDRRRGALRKAGAASHRRRLDLSVRPGRAGRRNQRLCPSRRGVSPGRPRSPGHHDRAGHRDRAVPRLSAGAPGDRARAGATGCSSATRTATPISCSRTS